MTQHNNQPSGSGYMIDHNNWAPAASHMTQHTNRPSGSGYMIEQISGPLGLVT